MSRALALLLATLALAPRLTEEEARGKAIYIRGERATAVMGDEGVEVPATVVPCASCHGYDGRGRAEGGVRPSNLRWDVLTKPYEVPGERQHPPYTRATIKRAITMGVDPAGNKLQTVMPRYRMADADLDDLLAYLEKLPSDADPGLTAEAIRIGVLLPPNGRAAATRALLEAYVSRLNRGGGIFGRKLELAFSATIPADEPFALVAASLIGVEEEVETLAERHQLPLLATIATGAPRGRYSFHLLAGLEDQVRALREFNPALVPIPGTATAKLADGRLAMAIPALPSDAAPPAIAELRSLGGDPAAGPTVNGTLASMKLIVEALRRAGRDVSREKLVETLEGFHEVDTGLVPRVTFGPNRHTGVTTAHVVVIEE
ncbi:MAG TPA: c-type cytochrome [Thermoanaerobaculia bacterium]|jgi:mono/diheme cytochrome c family protein